MVVTILGWQHIKLYEWFLTIFLEKFLSFIVSNIDYQIGMKKKLYRIKRYFIFVHTYKKKKKKFKTGNTKQVGYRSL